MHQLHQHMSTLTSIYNLRLEAGQKQQPRHASALRGLDLILKRTGTEHPYGEFNRELNAKLVNKTSYVGGSRGYLRTLHGEDFIYRLSGIKELAEDKTIEWTSHIKADQPASELFRLVRDDFRRVKDWIPLSRYAQGRLTGYRNITFWTTHQIQPERIIDDAHLIGITNNWLRQWSVIIRCKVADLTKNNNTRVPTALDAYTELIFHPTKDKDSPSSGITIKLNSDLLLTQGTKEFVLGHVEAEKIQLIPCYITNKSEPCIHSKDTELWDSLEDYYTTLCEDEDHHER
jgi:hypothetical protein